MIRVFYDEVDNNKIDKEEIAIHNMAESDKYYNLETLRHACMSWLKLDKTRTFKDLEDYFRKNKFNTYIVAKNNDIKFTDEYELVLPNGEKGMFLSEYICNSKAEEELLRTTTYEDNYNKLTLAGVIMKKNSVDEQNNDNVNNEVSLINKLIKNEIKLRIKYLTPEESINQLSEDFKKTYNYKPKVEMLGIQTMEEGGDILLMGFKDKDGKIPFNIGWLMKKEGDKIIYTLVNLNEYLSPI